MQNIFFLFELITKTWFIMHIRYTSFEPGSQKQAVLDTVGLLVFKFAWDNEKSLNKKDV